MPEHVVFLTQHDAKAVRGWSGTPYHMGRALRRVADDVTYVTARPEKTLTFFRAAARAKRIVTGRRQLPNHSPLLSRIARPGVERAIGAAPEGPIVALAASRTLGTLRTDRRVVYSSDATVRLMIDYYPIFTNLAKGALRDAEAMEKASLDRADLLIYSSRWAADSAIADYGQPEEKVHVAYFGANFETVPDAAHRAETRRDGPCRLLFVGVDWEVKGGSFALETIAALNGRGFDCELTIVGCVPPAGTDVPPNVTVIPFLDKSVPEQASRLLGLYRDADLFFLPTRAECAAMVFSEAAAYGLPSVAPAIGGIPEVVIDGTSGRILPADAAPADYADAIENTFADRDALRELGRAARRRYDEVNNWDRWGDDVARLLSKLD